MTTAIAEYSPTEAALAELGQRYKGIVYDVATTAGMNDARKARMEIRKLRTALEAKRVEIKAPALERTRLIDSEAKRITAALLALETPIDEQIKSEETRKENERLEKERKERERIERIQSLIAKISADAAAMAGKSSELISAAIIALSVVTIEWADEFKGQAQDALNAANQTLNELLEAAQAQESEQERIRLEREELARLRAEQEQRDREAKAKAEAEQRQRDEEERQRRAKIEADERAARERIEAQEREARLKREEEDRIAREKREAEEREARKRQAEEDERLRKERDRIEAERREVEARERKAREEAEAKAREERRRQAELMDGMQMLQTFVERYGKREEFKAIAKTVSAWLAKQAHTESA